MIRPFIIKVFQDPIHLIKIMILNKESFFFSFLNFLLKEIFFYQKSWNLLIKSRLRVSIIIIFERFEDFDKKERR